MSHPLSPHPSAQALMRYRIVSVIWFFQARGHSLTEAIHLTSEQLHQDGRGQARHFSRRTLYRWHRAFEAGGLPALERKSRVPLKGSIAIRDQLLDYLIEEHELDPGASIPELLERAKVLGHLRSEEAVHRSTVHRVFKRLGLPTRPQSSPTVRDSRRWAHPERLQMVVTDGKHFRAGVKRAKRVAIYILDDSTRFGLDIVVAPSETVQAFLKVLHRTIEHWGLFTCLYCDNGKAFVGDDSTAVLAKLDIKHIKGTAGYPEGHGKIERFNRSLKRRVLDSLEESPDVDPDCGALTLRLRYDLHHVYNHRPHVSLGNDTPYERFMASQRRLKPTPSEDELKLAFSIPATRLVSKDHVIRFKGGHFEVPRGYARQKITVHRRTLEGNALYLFHEEAWLRLHPVDLTANATSLRGHRKPIEHSQERRPRATASTLAFERAHGSILDADGGFKEPSTIEEEE